MVTKEQLLQAAQGIVDAELQHSLVELQFIRDMMVKEGNVSATVLMTRVDEAQQLALSEQLTQAFRNTGASEVHLRFRVASDYEQAEAKKRISGVATTASSGTTGGAAGSAKEGAEIRQPQGAESIAAPERGVQFVAIASGKGGVGKSTVTVNLAVALARLGVKVGIIDADIYGFSVPDMMGIEERPQVIDGKVQPPERFGVKVISMGFFVEDNSPVIWRGPMLGKMLRNFLHEVNWGDVEVVLLDLPPGTGDIALDVHQMIPHSKEVIVTTPHATAAFVAARAGAMAVHTKHDILGVVENMAYYACSKCGEKDYVFGRGGGAKLADQLHTSLLAQIPLGAPDTHPSEVDYAPSVYREQSETGQLYLDLGREVLERIRLAETGAEATSAQPQEV